MWPYYAIIDHISKKYNFFFFFFNSVKKKISINKINRPPFNLTTKGKQSGRACLREKIRTLNLNKIYLLNQPKSTTSEVRKIDREGGELNF